GRRFLPAPEPRCPIVRSCPSLVDSCPAAIGGRDWGANWEEAWQDCGRRTWRWIRAPPSLWLGYLPGSEKKTGGLQGKDRSGFTWHRRTRRVARERDRQIDGKGRGTPGRARG